MTDEIQIDDCEILDLGRSLITAQKAMNYWTQKED